MLTRLNDKYVGLGNRKQLLLIFIAYWIFWFFLELTSQWFAGEDYPAPELRHFTSSFFVAIVWTLISDFNKVKRLFKRKNVNVD